MPKSVLSRPACWFRYSRGETPEDFRNDRLKCDGETTIQSDIDNGIVNIEVGFAPLNWGA